MPKERRDRGSSKNADENKAKTESFGVEDKKEWREARCPVCMEHPHNAVLLICSSHEKGCRPYTCNTSYRLSNCLNLFLKLAADKSLTERLEEDEEVTPASASNRRRNLSKLFCPLCRGKISNWIVVDPAREYMNSKKRSCSLENCDFVGNYSEIRKHARSVHPKARPMEMDPTRQLDWERLEHQIDLQDLDSAMLEGGDEFEYEEYEQGGGGGGGSSPIGHQPMEMDPTRHLDRERSERQTEFFNLEDNALSSDEESEYEDDEVTEGGGGGRSWPININFLIRRNRRIWRTGNRHTRIWSRDRYAIRANWRSGRMSNTHHLISSNRRRRWRIF